MRPVLSFTAAVVLMLLLPGCRNADPVRDFSSSDVILPDGNVIKAEVMVKDEDMTRGMMFRDSLAPDRGMLFMHQRPGMYPYWMFQVKIPLDLIWMDRQRRIVEIVPDVPPCTSKDPRECKQFGGNAEAMYVLELAGGSAARHGLQKARQLQF